MKTSPTTNTRPDAALRDDAILATLAAGPLPMADLVEQTAMIERRIERGLRRLVAADYVFSPLRGTYRLTPRGRAVCPEPGATAGGDGPAASRPRRTAAAASEPRPLDLTL